MRLRERLARLARWVREAGTEEPRIDKLTDEVERAIAGERTEGPWRRYAGVVRR